MSTHVTTFFGIFRNEVGLSVYPQQTPLACAHYQVGFWSTHQPVHIRLSVTFALLATHILKSHSMLAKMTTTTASQHNCDMTAVCCLQRCIVHQQVGQADRLLPCLSHFPASVHSLYLPLSFCMKAYI